MKHHRQVTPTYVRGSSGYRYASGHDDNGEPNWHKRLWDERANMVNTHIKQQPVWQRVRIRMTGKRWWPAKWRSAMCAEFATLMINLEFVEERMMLPTALRDAVGKLRKVVGRWPEAYRDMSPLAIRTALSEMRRMDAALRRINPQRTTVMTSDHVETRKRIEHGTKVLAGLLHPKVLNALLQPSATKKIALEAPQPGPLSIDMKKARALNLSDALIGELEAFLATTEEWKAAQSSVDLSSKRNQVEYFISQIDGAWKAMVNDPVILRSPEAQDQFAEMITASRERIRRVVYEAEAGKVGSFMGTLSALRLQLER